MITALLSANTERVCVSGAFFVPTPRHCGYRNVLSSNVSLQRYHRSLSLGVSLPGSQGVKSYLCLLLWLNAAASLVSSFESTRQACCAVFLVSCRQPRMLDCSFAHSPRTSRIGLILSNTEAQDANEPTSSASIAQPVSGFGSRTAPSIAGPDNTPFAETRGRE